MHIQVVCIAQVLNGVAEIGGEVFPVSRRLRQPVAQLCISDSFGRFSEAFCRVVAGGDQVVQRS